jgi:hypothetical protein
VSYGNGTQVVGRKIMTEPSIDDRVKERIDNLIINGNSSELSDKLVNDKRYRDDVANWFRECLTEVGGEELC